MTNEERIAGLKSSISAMAPQKQGQTLVQNPKRQALNPVDIAFCRKLNRRRSQILKFLVDLLDLSVKKEQLGTELKAKKKNKKDIFALLVGIGFSLWRSVFLASAERSPKRIFQNAQQVLKRLVEDNSFTYQQEKEFKEWMLGFYVNDAAFRIGIIKSQFGARNLNKKSALARFNPNPVKDDDFDHWQHWDNTLAAAKDAVKKAKRGPNR